MIEFQMRKIFLGYTKIGESDLQWFPLFCAYVKWLLGRSVRNSATCFVDSLSFRISMSINRSYWSMNMSCSSWKYLDTSKFYLYGKIAHFYTAFYVGNITNCSWGLISLISVLGKSRQADIYEFKAILCYISWLHAIKDYIARPCLKTNQPNSQTKTSKKQNYSPLTYTGKI